MKLDRLNYYMPRVITEVWYECNTIILIAGPSNVGAFEFIQEGWRREWSNNRTVAEELVVGEVTLKPTGKTTTEEVI